MRDQCPASLGEQYAATVPDQQRVPTSRCGNESCWDTAEGVSEQTRAVAAIVPCAASSRSSRSRCTSNM